MVLVSSLAAEDEIDFSLINEVKSPIERIAGSVNMVSGHWIDSEAHLENSGPDGVPLAHSYASSNVEEGSLADGWDLFFPSDLEVFQPRGITYTPKESLYRIKGAEENRPTLFYREAGGSTVVFKGSEGFSDFEPKLKKSGYQHVNSIENPTRRNIHRIRIHEWRSHSDRWVVTLGDGTKRTYERSDKHKERPRPCQKSYFRRRYHITEERLPSGNRRYYSYNSDKELKKIETTSSKGTLIHKFTFDWHDNYVKVTSSDELSARFFFKKLKDNDRSFYLITKIEREGKPPLFYEYSEKSPRHGRRLRYKKSSNGCKTHAKFYHEGIVEVGNEKVSVDEKKDEFLLDRVRELYTRVLPAEPLKRSHSFFYHEGETRCHAKVQDSDGYKTYHYWAKDSSHPILTTRRDPEGALLDKERYCWDKERLTVRTIYDDTNTPQIATEYIFDDAGNVTRQIYRGSFLSPSSPKVTLDNDNSPHSGDKITIHAQYDKRSLKKAEQDPLGNWTYFYYEDKRDLLTARIMCEGTTPVKREFFSYNTAAVCTEEIVDDGSSFDRDSLSGVTRRYIHTIQPRQKTPFFGSPEEERWSVVTLCGGEKQVKRLSYIRDKKGRAIEKRLFGSNNSLQKTWHYEFDDIHRITKESDPTGAITEYTYNNAGLIETKKSPLAIFSYRYDLLDRVVEEKKSFPDGSSLSQSYTHTLTGREKTTIDERGRKSTTCLDSLGRTVSKTDPSIHTEDDLVSPTTTTTYTGRCETTTSPSGAITTIVRSASGKVLEKTNSFGAKSFYIYDKRDRLVEEHEATGLTTFYEYDVHNRVTKIVQKDGSANLSTLTKTYNGFDLVEECFDTKKISYSYDALGRKSKEVVIDLITNKSTTKHLEYDGQGRLTVIRDLELETRETKGYDEADRVIEQKLIGEDTLSLSTTVYDLAGRIIDQATGSSHVKTTYGAYGLPDTITYNDGSQTHISYNPLHKQEDGLFYFKRSTTDARGVTKEELLDANDQIRLCTIKDPFGNKIAHKKISVNLLGNPSSIDEESIANNTVLETITTRLSYDKAGQLTSCTLADKSPGSATWFYTYDDIGRKIEEKKPSGISLFSSYDIKGRLFSFKSSDKTIDYSYTYNQQDLPIEITNSGKKTSRSYDGLGNILSETLENGHRLLYERTPTGFLKTITYPDQSKTHYSYQNGRLSSIERNEYIYSVNSRNLFGVITKETLGSAGVVEHSFDTMGRPTRISHRAFSEERTLFDAVGCCLERTINGLKEKFSYNCLSQLLSDKGCSASYDSLFRRLKYKDKKAIHNARHQVLSVGREKFSYDTDGRRVSDKRFSYTYDACDRLLSVEDKTSRIEYSYDPFSRRLSSTTFIKNKRSSFETYLWQDENEIGSISEEGTSLRILGEGIGGEIGASVAIELSGEPFIPIHDLSGNIRALIDKEGSIQEEIFYTATGPVTPSIYTPWTFSSKRHDPITNFIYFGKRHYDPATSTWLTQDPLGATSSSNLYAYVNNNPLTTVDLHGLFGISDVCSAVCDGVSAAWNAVCGFCSSVGEFFSGTSASFGGGWDSFSFGTSMEEVKSEIQEKTQNCLSQSEKGFVSFVDRTGRGIRQSLEPFREKTMRLVAMINGILTRELDAFARMTEFLQEQTAYDGGLLCYNATEGLMKDLWETICNCFGFEGGVGATIKEGIMSFIDMAKEYSITIEITTIGHSQGAAIAKNLANSKEFCSGGSYGTTIQNRITFGAAAIDPCATNYISLGDPIPPLNPCNWVRAGYSDVRLIKPSKIAVHSFESYTSILNAA